MKAGGILNILTNSVFYLGFEVTESVILDSFFRFMTSRDAIIFIKYVCGSKSAEAKIMACD